MKFSDCLKKCKNGVFIHVCTTYQLAVRTHFGSHNHYSCREVKISQLRVKYAWSVCLDKKVVIIAIRWPLGRYDCIILILVKSANMTSDCWLVKVTPILKCKA